MQSKKAELMTGLCSILMLASCEDPAPGKPVAGGIQVQQLADTAKMRAALRQAPDSFSLRMGLANMLEKLGNPREAIALLEAGIARDSAQTYYWNRKASLHLALRDTTSAIGSILRSLTYEPGQTDLLLELGFIHADRKDPMALSIADRILGPQGDPRFHGQAFYLQGLYYGNAGQTDEALAAYDASIRSSYTFMDAYIEKGILLYERKRFPAAMAVFEKALAVNNTLADAYYWKGRCLESTGRNVDAVEYYRRALGLDEELGGARDGLDRLKY